MEFIVCLNFEMEVDLNMMKKNQPIFKVDLYTSIYGGEPGWVFII